LSTKYNPSDGEGNNKRKKCPTITPPKFTDTAQNIDTTSSDTTHKIQTSNDTIIKIPDLE
jgi:hypothetical protein